MIEVYRKQLEHCYKSYLKDIVLGRPFDPVILRGQKNKPANTVDLYKAVSMFQQYEKPENGYGWKIEWEDWSSKKLGRQKWVSRVTVATEEDYLFLLKKEKEADAFKAQLKFLLDWQPSLQSFLAEKPERVLRYQEVWKDAQKSGGLSIAS